jgi:pre-mRNA-splicing factor RBM22/SLT11
MVKLPFGSKLCQLTEQPFQPFRWKVAGGRTKETIISPQVAKERNICQACLSDMKFGLTAGMRDALESRDQPHSAPENPINAHYYYAQQSMISAQQQEPGLLEDLRNVPANRQLAQFSQRLHQAHTSPVAWRNLPKLCTFWLQGKCTRVVRKACPFRPCNGQFVFPEIASRHAELHKRAVELCEQVGSAKAMTMLDEETRDALKNALKGNKQQAIRQRIQGEDDLTKRYLNRMKKMNLELTPPSDPTIMTLWVGGVTDAITEQDLRDVFYAYGLIQSVYIARPSKCAFIEYSSRQEAEYAAKMLYNSLTVRGEPLQLDWAKPRAYDDGTGASTLGGGAAGSSAKAGVAAAAFPTLAPPPPGMEHAPASAYALPDLPLAANTIPMPPPPPPGPPPAQAASVGGDDVAAASSKKRASTDDRSDEEKVGEDGGPATKRPHNTLSARTISAAPPVQSAAGAPKPPSYPSMNPQRLGAKYT